MVSFRRFEPTTVALQRRCRPEIGKVAVVRRVCRNGHLAGYMATGGRPVWLHRSEHRGARGHGSGHGVSRLSRFGDIACNMLHMVLSEPWYSLSEAAAACSRSRVTVRRYLDAGRFPNARRDESDPNRAWLVPLRDLRDAGLRPSGDTGSSSEEGPADLVVRLAVAEALAAERAAEIARLEAVIAALTAHAAVALAEAARGERV